MKIKYIDEKDKENCFEKGSHIVLISPLPDKKPRHGYLLECENPTKILVQMENSSDEKETSEIVEINGKEVKIRDHYLVTINININKVLNTKKNTITEEKIKEIKQAADKSIINALEKGIYVNKDKLNSEAKNKKETEKKIERHEEKKAVSGLAKLNEERKLSEIEEYKDNDKDKEPEKTK